MIKNTIMITILGIMLIISVFINIYNFITIHNISENNIELINRCSGFEKINDSLLIVYPNIIEDKMRIIDSLDLQINDISEINTISFDTEIGSNDVISDSLIFNKSSNGITKSNYMIFEDNDSLYISGIINIINNGIDNPPNDIEFTLEKVRIKNNIISTIESDEFHKHYIKGSSNIILNSSVIKSDKLLRHNTKDNSLKINPTVGIFNLNDFGLGVNFSYNKFNFCLLSSMNNNIIVIGFTID